MKGDKNNVQVILIIKAYKTISVSKSPYKRQMLSLLVKIT